MLKAYKLIALTVHEESRTAHLGHNVDISEAVVDDVLKHIASLLSHDISYRHEWAHQEKGTGFS